MRRLALAAMAILAACSVKLEGAPCTSDGNCPDSQRCDGAGAQPGRCVACESDPACSADGFTCIDSHSIRECRTNAGTCHYALSIDCGTLTCTGSSPNASCPCPTNTLLYAVDAVQGSPLGGPFVPTGASSPTQCRFRRLGDALSAASTNETVEMVGWSQEEVRFSSAATGESFPLVVKPGVKLTSDSPSVSGHYVIEVDQAGGARPALQLDHDTAASGFTIQPAGSGSASEAVLVNCAVAGAAPVTLSDLVLDGKGSLGASAISVALRLAGPCSVSASAVTAENATGTGIRVETYFPMGGTAPTISIANSIVRGNGDGGLMVNVDASNGKPTLHVTGNDISLNKATTAYTDAATSVTRRGGGVVLLEAAPAPLVFTGNLVHGNSYDQILVYSSDPAWTISGAACDATSNVVTCYDTTTSGGPYFGLAVLGGAAVNASYDSWSHAVPAAGTDYYKTLLSTVTTNPSCAASTLTCP